MAKQLQDPLEPGGGGGPHTGSGSEMAGLSLLALGIVFGDIGTSPLYALRECFHGPFGVAPSEANVLGVLSLIFWSLVIVISVKYLLYILRANNRGEGGILSLMAFLHPSDEEEEEQRESGRRPPRAQSAWVALGLFGATLLYADGTITPAISVLSAVEGLAVATPVFEPFVRWIAAGILLGLFAFQSRGTAGVGRIFGPVMALWFATLAALGAASVATQPEVLRALDPAWAWRFFAANGAAGYVVLAAVFLVVTGGEALYADIGHFGVRPIRLAWFGLVLPALMLNYLGQGTLLLSRPEAAGEVFYRLAPDWALLPLVVLATAATVIASQAVISGAFSLTRQAIQLGYCPRMLIRHTSQEHLGQVFLPGVNAALAVVTLGLIFAFGSSSALAGAYGVAVSTTMGITTALTGWVALHRWGWPAPAVWALSLAFLLVDFAFLGANLTKLGAGAWFPLALALLLCLLMSTWKRGVEMLEGHFAENATALSDFVDGLAADPPQRVPGVAVFLTARSGRTPTALLHQLEHNRVLHERVLVLTVRAARLPVVPVASALKVDDLPLGFQRVTVRHGFMQHPDVPRALRANREKLPDLGDPEGLSYFTSREEAIATPEIGMPRWRAWLFGRMARNARRSSEFLNLPHDRVIELGVQVEI